MYSQFPRQPKLHYAKGESELMMLLAHMILSLSATDRNSPVSLFLSTQSFIGESHEPDIRYIFL